MQTKDPTFSTRELQELHKANVSLNFFSTTLTEKRVQDVEINTFDLDSDSDSEVGGEALDQIQNLRKNTDSLLYDKIRSLTNNSAFLGHLKDVRKTGSILPVSEQIASFSHRYQISSHVIQAIALYERQILQDATNLTQKEYIKHTDIAKRLEAVQQFLDKFPQKRKKKLNHSSSKRQCKSDLKSNNTGDLGLYFLPIKTDKLSKAECENILASVADILKKDYSGLSKKALLNLHFLLLNAFKNITNFVIDLTVCDLNEVQIDYYTNLYAQHNEQTLQLCMLQLNDFETNEIPERFSMLCQRLAGVMSQPIFNKKLRQSDTTFFQQRANDNQNDYQTEETSEENEVSLDDTLTM